MDGPTHRRSGEEEQREVIDVEVERLDETPTPGESVRKRVVGALLPVALALAIDTGDLALGLFPVGRALVLPLGLVAGFFYSGYLRVAPTWRVIVTCMVGIYLMTPFTGMIPLATVITAASGIFEGARMREEPFA